MIEINRPYQIQHLTPNTYASNLFINCVDTNTMLNIKNQKQQVHDHVSLVSTRIIDVLPFRNGDLPFILATDRKYLLAKRGLDLAISILVIVCILSWMMPILAILIKLDSKGPVLFCQKRIGRNGIKFLCIKLRTMYPQSVNEELPAILNDKRVTRIGNILRRANLDELPQFFNVILGQMSITGPRPYTRTDCIRFSFVIPSYHFRHLVKPGMTGWAQVKGFHGPAPDYESIMHRFFWDMQYILKKNILLDLRIIFLTIRMKIG